MADNNSSSHFTEEQTNTNPTNSLANNEATERLVEQVRRNDWKMYRVSFEHGYPPALLGALMSPKSTSVKQVHVLLEGMTEQEQLQIADMLKINQAIKILRISVTTNNETSQPDSSNSDDQGNIDSSPGAFFLKSLLKNAKQMALTSIRTFELTHNDSLQLLGKLTRTMSEVRLHITLSQSYFLSAFRWPNDNDNKKAFFLKACRWPKNYIYQKSEGDSEGKTEYIFVSISLEHLLHKCERAARYRSSKAKLRRGSAQCF